MTEPDTGMIRGFFEIDADTPEQVFEGWHHPEHTWNGFAVPSFDRANALKVISWVAGTESIPVTTFHWDGDVLVMTEAFDDGDEVQHIPPDEHGRYSIGACYWTWQELILPENVELGVYLRQRREDAIVRVSASNLVNDWGRGLGLDFRSMEAPRQAAARRAVEHLHRLRPDDPNAPLPTETLACVVPDGPGRSGTGEHPLTWARLSDVQRRTVLNLAVALIFPPVPQPEPFGLPCGVWRIDGDDLRELHRLLQSAQSGPVRVRIGHGVQLDVGQAGWSRPLGIAEDDDH
jgi:hypothetical protein